MRDGENEGEGHEYRRSRVLYDRVLGETKQPNPQARLFNLQTVTASRFAFNGQHDRRGMVMWAEKESAGKSRNAQSDVRAVQSKNERRELKQNSQSARERARVCHGCTHTVATEESEAS